jgi:hypothetical protein
MTKKILLCGHSGDLEITEIASGLLVEATNNREQYSYFYGLEKTQIINLSIFLQNWLKEHSND